MKFGFDCPAVSEEIFVNDGPTTDAAGPWVYYKLTCEPTAQVS